MKTDDAVGGRPLAGGSDAHAQDQVHLRVAQGRRTSHAQRSADRDAVVGQAAEISQRIGTANRKGRRQQEQKAPHAQSGEKGRLSVLRLRVIVLAFLEEVGLHNMPARLRRRLGMPPTVLGLVA